MRRLMWSLMLGLWLLSGAGCKGGSSDEVTWVKNPPTMPEETTCVVSGEPSKPEYTVLYKGQHYYLCCKKCIRAFQSEPERYATESTPAEQAHAH